MARIGPHGTSAHGLVVMLLRTAMVSLLLLALTGCFTMGLWGYDTDSERDPVTGAREATYTYDEETQWSWGLLLGRVLLTPVALCLDCLTAPAQIWLLGDGDDEQPEGPDDDRSFLGSFHLRAQFPAALFRRPDFAERENHLG